jgi:GTP cyclohydrolase IB
MVKNSNANGATVTPELVDIQSSYDSRAIAIQNVGVKGVRHPISVQNSNGDYVQSVANINMAVSLPSDVKGTHMSRFIELLHEGELRISYQSIRQLLPKMLERLDSNSGTIEIQFPFFTSKKAPVSGVESILDHDVCIEGEMKNGVLSLKYKVTVPVTSLCPCSKKISKYGAHNQRSEITMNVEALNSELSFEELIEIAESSSSCDLYGILKRPDEKYVTEKAYENPMFVEDMVRDVSAALSNHPNIGGFSVEVENFESIHNHSAFAIITSE